MENLCPHQSCLCSSMKGLSHGIAYGAKVRFTHSLVMAALFSNDPLWLKLYKILKNTQEHASKLAIFVTIFKSLVCILTKLTGQSSSRNHAISGLLTGLIWSKDTSVNTQVTLYLFSRNLVGNAKLLHKKKIINFPDFLVQNSFCILTVLCWGIVMYLFETHPKELQNSLTSSMDFLYKDSDKWRGWRYCIPYCDHVLKVLGYNK
ncbi:hypothetical protein SteCoe_10929 [Stentor coeruleus]|uniref:Peroxisomal membrane protein 4 n=1 Tax=Stentor coeruleus TaxID=5963 RepID=A0A1R2CE88_9CILI|nr:hypothetical protein SteCoe_10929 [Stentor coeruleus]